ncbi:MAG: hypothetical protein LBS89_07120 [Zoogloeaceae bacterium]|jgi:hypothetical protein|nr:hypothetical protein [Zoogloeaceae bacterium]
MKVIDMRVTPNLNGKSTWSNTVADATADTPIHAGLPCSSMKQNSFSGAISA